MSKTITIRLDSSLAQRLELAAENARRSRSDIIRTSLRRQLEFESDGDRTDAELLSYPSGEDNDSWKVSEPKQNPIKEKSFTFALEIIELCRKLQDQREYVLSKQLLRSGTSIGANIEEATAAESRADFIHKMTIASKEARETHYWLRLLDESGIAKETGLDEILSQADELKRMLTAIVKTSSSSKPG
jgi:four helix bundle protein